MARDRVGAIHALTTLSPIARLQPLRRRLRIVSKVPGIGRPLLDLSFIHFARWLVLEHLPGPDGSGAPWRLNWPQLLFEATFDGPEDEYLDTFADVLPLRLTRIFGDCVDFSRRVHLPDPDRRVISGQGFREFVDENKLEILDFVDGGPVRSVSAIRQSIAIERLERRSNRLSGAALDRVQREVETMALGPLSQRVGWRDAVVDPWLRRARRDVPITPVTLVAPVLPRRIERLSRQFADRSVLAAIPRSHFARLAVITPSVTDVGQQHPDRLPVYYLVFTADADGGADDYRDALRTTWAEGLDALFEHCPRYPGTGYAHDFDDWWGRHSIRTRYYVAGYPARTVPELTRLVRVRTRLNRWLMTGPPAHAEPWP